MSEVPLYTSTAVVARASVLVSADEAGREREGDRERGMPEDRQNPVTV